MDTEPQPKPIDRVFLKRLRILSFVEAVSTLILFFIAMPLKYAAGMPIAVVIVGYIHGILFFVLVIAFMLGMYRIPISQTLATWGVIGAFFPFGPFVVDRWLRRIDSGEAEG